MCPSRGLFCAQVHARAHNPAQAQVGQQQNHGSARNCVMQRHGPLRVQFYKSSRDNHE